MSYFEDDEIPVVREYFKPAFDSFEVMVKNAGYVIEPPLYDADESGAVLSPSYEKVFSTKLGQAKEVFSLMIVGGDDYDAAQELHSFSEEQRQEFIQETTLEVQTDVFAIVGHTIEVKRNYNMPLQFIEGELNKHGFVKTSDEESFIQYVRSVPLKGFSVEKDSVISSVTEILDRAFKQIDGRSFYTAIISFFSDNTRRFESVAFEFENTAQYLEHLSIILNCSLRQDEFKNIILSYPGIPPQYSVAIDSLYGTDTKTLHEVYEKTVKLLLGPERAKLSSIFIVHGRQPRLNLKSLSELTAIFQ